MQCPKCQEEMIAADSFLLWNTVRTSVIVHVCPDPHCLEAIASEDLFSGGRGEKSSMFVAKAMVQHEMAATIGEARRCIRQKGVKLNGKILTKSTERLRKGDRLEVGKTRVVIHDPITGEKS